MIKNYDWMIEVVSVVVKIFPGGGGKRLNTITDIQLKHYSNAVNRFILTWRQFCLFDLQKYFYLAVTRQIIRKVQLFLGLHLWIF